jgi:DNA-binding response OmpR family regulator
VGYQLTTIAADILLIEDDRRLAELTAEYFEQNGLSVVIEERGDRALAQFARVKPRVVLLDLMLPGLDGLTICRELRETFNGPILIFTARDSDIDQVIGLEAGADDYVAKPVDPMVLLARTRALLRRVEDGDTPAAQSGDITLGKLRISPSAQEVQLDEKLVPLTTHEFELLLLEPRRYLPPPAWHRLQRHGSFD